MAPSYLSILFIAVSILAVILFLAAIRGGSSTRTKVLGIIVVWAIIQSAVAASGYYEENIDAVPPRLVLVLAPTLLFFLILLLSSWGKAFLDTLNIRALTMLSIVRIPVELGLYGLFLAGALPELMTFAGRNFDILAGLTAPFVAIFCFRRENFSKGIVWLWNIASLLLLISIICIAVLSAPTAFQQFGFDQPNVALFRFPFVLLPAIIVPLVLLSHIASFRLLSKMK